MTHRVRWGGVLTLKKGKKLERPTQLKFALDHLWFTRGGQHRAEISRLT